MSFRKIILGFLLLSTTLIVQSAEAQYNRGILPEGKLSFHFTTIPEADDNMIHMVFYNPIPVEGCADIKPYTITQEIRGIDLYLELENPVITPDRTVRNPQYECHKGPQRAQTIIALNKDTLIENGVKMMTLKTPGSYRRFQVEINDDMIRLTPEGPGLPESIEHWFLPDNTVVLSVPGASENIAANALLMDQLRRIATLRNLTPIEEMKPGFHQHSGNKKRDHITSKRFYFIDRFNTLKTALGEKSYVTIGNLEITEPYFGPEGRYDKVRTLPIYASRPGLPTN